MTDKRQLRAEMKALRRDTVAALPAATRGLLFMRPPRGVADWAAEGSIVGLYHAAPDEAPTRGYAKWLFENGRRIALPWFADRDAPMRFKEWRDPYDDSDLAPGPFGLRQPLADAEDLSPALVFAPLIAFTAAGARLGQGGGHYDRWLAANRDAVAVGLAWDSQLVDALPIESHDQPLRAVVTPTRLYEGQM